MVSLSPEDPPPSPSPAVAVPSPSSFATVASSSPTLLRSSSSSSFTAISEKLDSENYLLWCQQVEPMIKAHKLHHFLVNQMIPPKFNTIEDSYANRVSPEFEKWEQQDQLLLAWLQSTISKDMLHRVIGLKHAWQLWDKIHVYFQSHMQAKARQLRSELRGTTLDTLSVSNFLLRVQSLVDSLKEIFEPVSSCEHLDIVLEGLPQEYESTVSLICGRFGPVSMEEVTTLLLGHESRLNRFKKQSIASANVTTSMNPNSTNCNRNTTGKSYCLLSREQFCWFTVAA